MRVEIRSQQSHRVDHTVAEVWGALQRVDDYPRWWPWLRRLDAEAVRTGDVWSCTVQPPVPYSLRFQVHLGDVIEQDDTYDVHATVDGDIVGTAHLHLAPADGACEITLASVLRPESLPLQLVATFTPWIARFGHDRVLDAGIEQFRRRAW